MDETLFTKRVKPLTARAKAHLRLWVTTAASLPAAGYKGAAPVTVHQALLLLSLTYGAGVKPDELAKMQVDALLDDLGCPSSHVRIAPETTKHRVSRRVPMHPDIARDLIAFRRHLPTEQWVAFVRSAEGRPARRPMSEYALDDWFRRLLKQAGLEGLSVRSGRKMFNDMQRRD